MSKSCISGVIVALLMIVQGLAHAQTTAPATQPEREKFVYRASLINAERFARLIDLLMFQSEGQTVSRITGASTLPAGESPERSASSATRPVEANGATGQWRTLFTFTIDPTDHSMLVSTLPERWPEIKRLLDRLQDALAMVSIQATIVEMPKEARDAAIADLAKFAATQELNKGGAPTIASSQADFSILNENAAKVLESLDPTRKFKVVGETKTTAHLNTLSMLRFTANQTEIFPAEKSAEASRATGIEAIIDMIPHAMPDRMIVLEINSKARGQEQNFIGAATTLPMLFPQSRVAIEDGQTLVLSAPYLKRANANANPLLVLLTVSLLKDE